MTVANRKRLEAAHHRWRRRILHISWRDKITKKDVRIMTGEETFETIIRMRRLRWMGHVFRMEEGRRARQVIAWNAGGRRKRGRPKKNWPETIREDLRSLELTLEEAEKLTTDRDEWRRCVARCALCNHAREGLS